MSKGDFSGIAKKAKLNIENFIEEASVDGEKTLNSRAKRDYKSIRLAFNEYEYRLLEEAAIEANLSLVAFIRTSWMARAKQK